MSVVGYNADGSLETDHGLARREDRTSQGLLEKWDAAARGDGFLRTITAATALVEVLLPGALWVNSLPLTT